MNLALCSPVGTPEQLAGFCQGLPMLDYGILQNVADMWNTNALPLAAAASAAAREAKNSAAMAAAAAVAAPPPFVTIAAAPAQPSILVAPQPQPVAANAQAPVQTIYILQDGVLVPLSLPAGVLQRMVPQQQPQAQGAGQAAAAAGAAAAAAAGPVNASLSSGTHPATPAPASAAIAASLGALAGKALFEDRAERQGGGNDGLKGAGLSLKGAAQQPLGFGLGMGRGEARMHAGAVQDAARSGDGSSHRFRSASPASHGSHPLKRARAIGRRGRSKSRPWSGSRSRSRTRSSSRSRSADGGRAEGRGKQEGSKGSLKGDDRDLTHGSKRKRSEEVVREHDKKSDSGRKESQRDSKQRAKSKGKEIGDWDSKATIKSKEQATGKDDGGRRRMDEKGREHADTPMGYADDGGKESKHKGMESMERGRGTGRSIDRGHDCDWDKDRDRGREDSRKAGAEKQDRGKHTGDSKHASVDGSGGRKHVSVLERLGNRVPEVLTSPPSPLHSHAHAHGLARRGRSRSASPGTSAHGSGHGPARDEHSRRNVEAEREKLAYLRKLYYHLKGCSEGQQLADICK